MICFNVNRKHKSRQRQTADTHVVYDSVTGEISNFYLQKRFKEAYTIVYYLNRK